MKVYSTFNCRSGEVVELCSKASTVTHYGAPHGRGWWWGFLIDVFMTAKCQNATGKTNPFYTCTK
jgi:hypothetical protein